MNAGSWRCVGRNHQAVHPLKVPKGNVETIGEFIKLSGQRRCKFPRTSEAQAHQAKKAKSEPGRDLQSTKGSVSRRDASTWRGRTVQKPSGDAPPRCARREGSALREGKLRGAKQSRARAGGAGRRAGPGEAGEVRRRGRLGRAGRRRPGSPRALAGAEGGGGPFPSLPASLAAGRAAPGRLSLTCAEVEGDAGLGEVGGVALGADAADGSAVDVLLGRCRH